MEAKEGLIVRDWRLCSTMWKGHHSPYPSLLLGLCLYVFCLGLRMAAEKSSVEKQRYGKPADENVVESRTKYHVRYFMAKEAD